MIRYVLFISCILALTSCKKSEPALFNKFADTIVVKISDFQDQRLADSLASYLENSNASYRREAVLAYASIQDSTHVEAIGKLLLNDTDSSVRRAAAFAVGQTPDVKSEQLLYQSSNKETSKQVLPETIEAYGKVSTSWRLDLRSDDTVITNALAWSYYRMAVREQSNDVLNGKAAEFLKSHYAKSTRLGAAHYFSRGAKNFEKHQEALILSATRDTFPEIRMAATLALKKINSEPSRIAIQKILKHDPDYRVRINALRALQIFPFHLTKILLIKSLRDSVASVGVTASEVIKSAITKESWKEISMLARAINNWRIQANLYEAALSVSDHKELAEEIRTTFNKSSNPYQKAALINALQHSVMSYGFVQKQLFGSTVPVVKSSAASTLTAMNYHKNFDHALKIKFVEIYKAAINVADAAVVGTIANALADSVLDYKSTISDYSFLHEARSSLSLPKDFESIISLEMAIAYFEGKKITSRKNNFNHPIPWSLVKKIPRDQKAIIKTSKGNIFIRLFVEETPGSVANFVTLVSNHYYDDKYFHRVVPNFVVQGGCPRGDGWGSEDYSIRSEFTTRRYKTGSIGMASAGKDTEGTQWFITHSPTPHLDGRYTLFAEVERGMDVVDQIEVGDRIISIELIELELGKGQQ
ncbi:MAG TPA: peptidylprolyl isomerase, partial [Chryseolinea sp.]|nr:peptidylprolyl isomerase [Chryseolinea sp.]